MSGRRTAREESKMKSLSELLMDLAARVKRLEDSAAAVQERNRAAPQKRRGQLDAAIERERQDVDKTAGDARGSARTWRSGTKGAIERQVAAMRADFEKLKEKNAELAAEEAEDDAVVDTPLLLGVPGGLNDWRSASSRP